MALTDLTVDTNVFLHSCNPTEPRHVDSVAMMKALLDCSVKLAMDAGFAIDPASNRSLIGAEYISKLVPGTLPAAVLSQLALTGRVVMVSHSIPAQLSRKLNQLVSNRRDRTFIRVCVNSSERVFVSHDFQDFPQAKRQNLRKLLAISIVEAQTCSRLL